MEEYDIDDFSSVLYLKNVLLCKESRELVNLYSDFDDYVKFINSFIVMSNIDSGFLFLDEKIVSKIRDVIQIHRYDEDLSDEIKKAINDIILYLNSLNDIPEYLKANYIDNYVFYNEEVRNVDILDVDQLCSTLSFDAIAFIALITGQKELLVDKARFLISLNYLMATIPDFFKDSNISDRVVEFFDDINIKEDIEKDRRRFKKYIKATKNNFSKLVLKGE